MRQVPAKDEFRHMRDVMQVPAVPCLEHLILAICRSVLFSSVLLANGILAKLLVLFRNLRIEV